MDYYKGIFKKYAVFTGRARRAEFWNFVLFNAIFIVVINIFSSMIGDKFKILSIIYSSILIVPVIALQMRRFHDIGKSGWWTLLIHAPVFPVTVFSYLIVFNVISQSSVLQYISTSTSPLLGFLLFAYAVLMFVTGIWFTVLMATRGNVGENKYGPDPIKNEVVSK